MMGTRERRVRVLEALDTAVKQFRTREPLHPLRVPREPLALDEVVAAALGDDARLFDAASLRSRTLLSLQWRDGSTWELWVAILPSGLKLFCDSGEEESRVLASGGRNAGDDSDRLFLELLSESGGDHFGIEMSGGVPSRVRSSVGDVPFLVDVFVNLFEGSEVEEAVREASTSTPEIDHTGGRDFRVDVGRWLAVALAAPRLPGLEG
jgi:hypothetical protein